MLYVTKSFIDHHAFDASNIHWFDVGGVGEARVAGVTFGSKLSHDTAESLSPIAGSKGFAIVGETLDKELFGRHDVFAV